MVKQERENWHLHDEKEPDTHDVGKNIPERGNEEKAEIQQAISVKCNKCQLHFKQLLSTYYESASSKFEEMYKCINNYATSMY